MLRAIAQRILVVRGVVVGDARLAAVHVGAAELLGRDLLARGRLHERRAAEEDGPLLLDDHRLVAHRGHVGAARRAGAEHDGDLRRALGREPRLVVEDAAEVLAVGEDLVLQRQEGAARVDQVDAGQAVLGRDLLRAQVLLDGDGEVGAALDRGVVGDDHALAPAHAADAGDQPRAGRRVVVEPARGQGAELEEGPVRVQQLLDAIAHEELAAAAVALDEFRAAALLDPLQARPQVRDEGQHVLAVGLEGGVVRVDAARDLVHAPAFVPCPEGRPAAGGGIMKAGPRFCKRAEPPPGAGDAVAGQ